MCSSFLRFQEHYESPEFRGKIFTLGQYHDWYAQENGGATYTRDWGGFNVPDYVLKPFVQGLFDPLTKEEQEIVDLFRYRTDKFYLIGTADDGDEDAYDHEVCHGLFYTSDDYREAVLTELKEHDLKHLHKFLKLNGYCAEVMDDEAHAYISASGDYLEEKGIDFDKGLQKTLQRLNKMFLKKEI
jgi:hypothetical protein